MGKMEGPEQIPLIPLKYKESSPKRRSSRPRAIKDGRIPVENPTKAVVNDKNTVKLEGEVRVSPDERVDDVPRFGH